MAFFSFSKKSQEAGSSEVIQCDPFCLMSQMFLVFGFNSKSRGKNATLLINLTDLHFLIY